MEILSVYLLFIVLFNFILVKRNAEKIRFWEFSIPKTYLFWHYKRFLWSIQFAFLNRKHISESSALFSYQMKVLEIFPENWTFPVILVVSFRVCLCFCHFIKFSLFLIPFSTLWRNRNMFLSSGFTEVMLVKNWFEKICGVCCFMYVVCKICGVCCFKKKKNIFIRCSSLYILRWFSFCKPFCVRFDLKLIIVVNKLYVF